MKTKMRKLNIKKKLFELINKWLMAKELMKKKVSQKTLAKKKI